MRRALRRIALALGLVALGLGAFSLFAGLWLRASLRPRSASAKAVIVTIEPGASLAEIAAELEREGVVWSALATRIEGRRAGLASRLQAGEYELSPARTPAELLRQIAEGRVRTIEIVIPEGWSARQIAERLEAAQLCERKTFLALVDDPMLAADLGVEGPGLEGYLFPATYRFPRRSDARTIARAMVERFLVAWRPLAPEAAALGLAMRPAVTLASIVEKETASDAERPLVASVYRNRLARGMKLDSDPTVIYGIPNFDGDLVRAHLEDASNRWNTYARPGLPPGPIASPGEASLRAVVRPVASEYLYFVARGDGTHEFSRSYDEHRRAVARHQRRGAP